MTQHPTLRVAPSITSLDGAEPRRGPPHRPSDADVAVMLKAIGHDSLDSLMHSAVPGGIRTGSELDLPEALSETAVAKEMRRLATANRPAESLIGQGYYDTITPPVIRRNVLESPAWYTAYTPYQPEISQGRLEALLNFQTLVSDLSGLPIANASMLDEATAAAEAMTLVRRAQRKATGPFVVDADALPQTLDVLRTRAEPLGIEVVVADLTDGLPGDVEAPCGVLVQYPGASGEIRDPRAVIEAVHEQGGLAVVAADLLALTLLESPGELGADVAVGSSQRFGVPLFHGGPHAGYMAVKSGLERQLPGRLVGVSIDRHGKPAYRLAMQTREQHIRREKATSNICTAQVLLANIASMFAVYHGPEGLRSIAHARPPLRRAGGQRPVGRRDRGRDAILLRHPGRPGPRTGRRGRWPLPARWACTCVRSTRTASGSDLRDDHPLDATAVLKAFGIDVPVASLDEYDADTDALPEALRRTTDYPTHSRVLLAPSETQGGCATCGGSRRATTRWTAA